LMSTRQLLYPSNSLSVASTYFFIEFFPIPDIVTFASSVEVSAFKIK
jgi:hypothetical protein